MNISTQIYDLAVEQYDELLKSSSHEARELNYKNQAIAYYQQCIDACKKMSNYKLCLYDPNSTTYTVINIRINVPDMSDMFDYANIIKFTEYYEDGILKSFPNNAIGLIPNYRYIVGDNEQFKQNNRESLHEIKTTKDLGYSEYYLISVNVPFVTDRE